LKDNYICGASEILAHFVTGNTFKFANIALHRALVVERTAGLVSASYK